MRKRMTAFVLCAGLVLGVGCSSSDDTTKDAGTAKDTGVQPDKGTTPTPDTGPAADKGEPAGDQGAGIPGQLALQIWEMKTAASGKAMFDYNQAYGENDAGWTFEAIDDVSDEAIIISDYDGGWYVFGYRGPFVYEVVAQTAGDTAAFEADVIGFVKHLAGKLPDATAGKQVEEYVPAPGEVGGWIEDDQVGKPGVESAYDDDGIIAIIDGHHQPYQNEGTAGFAKQDYMK